MVHPSDVGLSNLEASLATFILHKDYRDYYEREGWSAYARFRFPVLPVELRAEYFQEDHAFIPVAGPWSLTKNNRPWRNQPLVAEGDLRYLEAHLTIDSRNSRDQPVDACCLSVPSICSSPMISTTHRAARATTPVHLSSCAPAASNASRSAGSRRSKARPSSRRCTS